LLFSFHHMYVLVMYMVVSTAMSHLQILKEPFFKSAEDTFL
jgi:hypothetical protein